MLQQQQSSAPEFLALPTFGDDDDDENGQPSAAGTTPPRRRRRGWIIGAAIILLIILLGGLIFALLGNRKSRVVYQQETVTQGNFSLTVNATGPLQGGVYNVVFSGQGILSEIDVKVGQMVQQGQLLAKLDRTSLQDAVDVAQANVAAAETTLGNSGATSGATQGVSGTSVAAAETALKNAEKNLVRARDVANANIAAARAACGATPPESCSGLHVAEDQAEANTATARAAVNTAQSQLATAQAQANLSDTTAQGSVNSAQSQLNTALDQLKTAQHNLNNTTLRAPHAGIVTVINGNVGGTPGVTSTSSSTATNTTTSSFIQIIDTSALQVVANVNESDTGNLKVGETAQFTVSAYGQRMFKGTVSAIAPNGVTVSNVVTYPVTIDVDPTSLQGANLLPGMTANVTIVVVQRSSVLLIPLSAVNFARASANANATTGAPALITRSQATTALGQARQMLSDLQAQNPSVSMDSPIPAFVLEQSGSTFTAKPVVVGLTDGVVYEVLAGLSPGETIIVGVQGGSGSGGSGGGGTGGAGGAGG